MPASSSRDRKIGVLYALGAFGFWGIVPIYFKAVSHVLPLEVLCHRVVWSVPLTGLMILLARERRALREALRSKYVWRALLLSATLVATNWFFFIYAITTHRILQASLGYYINPLVNVLLGIVFLRERLRAAQAVAVLLAAAGTLTLTLHYGQFPWLALVLGFSFGFYGLLRKTVRIESLNGLFVETTLISPLALAFLLWRGWNGFGAFGSMDWRTTALLVLAGAVTVFPLVCFTSAARRLRLSTVGLLQYLAPSLMVVLAVFLYGEPFSQANAVTFGLIWTGLAVFAWDTISQQRQARRM